ncbi:MAG: CHASE domain-containing protein, partial [Bdellovibrionales bacterium]|nr:CHASE domain-containing protein [Bdellovibrionales bacterium]
MIADKRVASQYPAEQLAAALCFLTIITLGILLQQSLVNVEQVRLEREFELLADRYSSGISEQTERAQEVSRSVTALFQSTSRVDRKGFQTFVQALRTAHPFIYSVEWAPYLEYSEIKDHEKVAEEQGHTGYFVHEQTTDGIWVPAEPRSAHLPVWFIEPPFEDSSILGFDLTSNEHRKAAIEQSLRTGREVTTRPLSLLHDPHGSLGILVIRPVFQKQFQVNQPMIKKPLGVTLTVVRIADLLDAVSISQKFGGLHLKLIDESANKNSIVLFNASEIGSEPMPGGISTTRRIQIGSRTWKVELSETEQFHEEHSSPLPPLVLIASFLFAFAISGYIYLLLRRRHTAELLFKERTSDLKKNEQRLKDSQRIAKVGSWLYSCSTNEVKWSEETYRIFGLSTDEPVPTLEGHTDLIAENDRELWKKQITNCLLGERVEFGFKLEDISLGERYMYFRAEKHRSLYGPGEVIRGSIQDITRLKQAELEATQARDRYQALTSLAPVAIYQTDLTGKCVYVNERWCELTGLTKEDSSGTSWLTAIHKEDKDNVSQRWYRSVEAAEKFDMKYRIQRSDGTVAHVAGLATPIIEDGIPIGYLGTVQDITVEQTVQERMARSNDLLQIISAAQERFLKSNKEKSEFQPVLEDFLKITQSKYGLFGEILHSNEGKPYLHTYAIAQYTGNEASRIVDEKFLASGLELNDLDSLLGKVVATGEPILSNTPSLPSPSTGLPSAFPPLDSFLGLPFYSGEELIGMVAIANRVGGYTKDMIEELQPFLATLTSLLLAYRAEESRKRIQMELNHYLMDIEASKIQMELQAEELARQSEELALSRDEAHAATKAKSRFLASMSHEIRTPLNGILGMAELVLDTDLTLNQRELIGVIKESGGSLLTIINDILDFSKVEAGKMELAPTTFRLSETIHRISQLLAVRVEEKNIVYQVSIADDISPLLYGDPDRLRQILVNLLGNAIKFTPDGGHITLRITTESSAAN